MDLPTAPLMFAQSFSKNSQETEFPFSGDFGGLRVGDCTIGDYMEVGSIPRAKRNSILL